LAEAVDDILIRCCTNASTKGRVVAGTRWTVLRDDAGSIGQDISVVADASTKGSVVLTVSSAREATIDSRIVSQGTSTLIVRVDSPSYTVAEGALLSEYISDLSARTDTC